MVPLYETIKAKSREEAMKKSAFQVGKKAAVVKVECKSLAPGAWYIAPMFELVEEKKDET